MMISSHKLASLSLKVTEIVQGIVFLNNCTVAGLKMSVFGYNGMVRRRRGFICMQP